MKEKDRNEKKNFLPLTNKKTVGIRKKKTSLQTIHLPNQSKRTHQANFTPCLPQSDPRIDYLLSRHSTPLKLTVETAQSTLPSNDPKNPDDISLNSLSFQKTQPHTSQLKIVSWNIDGLSSDDFIHRTKCILKIITHINPDVVYLQEVIDPTFEIIGTTVSKTYHCIRCEIRELNDVPYYCVLLLLKKTFGASSESFKMKTVWFPESQMGRHLLFVTCNVHDDTDPLCFLTAHLESCTESRDERMNQLQTTFLEMFRIVNDNQASLCIFGGDLNIRDKEATSVLEKLETMGIHFIDVWQVRTVPLNTRPISTVAKYLGSNSLTRSTWDSSYYSQDTVKRFTIKMRLDRMYLYTKNESSLLWKPILFQLLGKSKLPSTGRTPSDHLGLFVTFERS